MLMIGLELPKKKKFEGLFIYCQRCKKWINHDNHHSCHHPDKQVYRLSMRDPNTGKSVSAVLPTKDYGEAVKATVDFRNALISNVPIKINKENKKPENLVKAAAMYCDHLQNKNVPKHKRRVRSLQYTNDHRLSRNFNVRIKTILIV